MSDHQANAGIDDLPRVTTELSEDASIEREAIALLARLNAELSIEEALTRELLRRHGIAAWSLAFSLGNLLEALRTVDRLLAIEKSHRAVMDKQSDDIQQLKDRLTKLDAHVQAREEIMVAEAKAAASAIASTVASQHVAGIAQSVGRLQERLDGQAPRLPRPERDED